MFVFLFNYILYSRCCINVFLSFRTNTKNSMRRWSTDTQPLLIHLFWSVPRNPTSSPVMWVCPLVYVITNNNITSVWWSSISFSPQLPIKQNTYIWICIGLADNMSHILFSMSSAALQRNLWALQGPLPHSQGCSGHHLPPQGHRWHQRGQWLKLALIWRFEFVPSDLLYCFYLHLPTSGQIQGEVY